MQDAAAQVVNCTTPANYFHVLRRQVCCDLKFFMHVLAPVCTQQNADPMAVGLLPPPDNSYAVR